MLPSAIALVAYQAGFRDSALVTAIAVALAESNGNTTIKGYNEASKDCPKGSIDRGLWQINDCYHPEVSDACADNPSCAAIAAYRISDSGTDFSPWSTFTSGAYKDHQKVALKAAADATSQHKTKDNSKGLFKRELGHWHYYGQMTMPVQAGYPPLNRENDCGPACLTMCLQHWFDLYLSEDNINILEAGPNHVGYTTDIQMSSYLERAWSIATDLTIPLNKDSAFNYAKKQIQKRYCVVNLGYLRTGTNTFHHYTVTTGIDGNKVIIADPASGRRLVLNKDQYYDRSTLAQITPLKAR